MSKLEEHTYDVDLKWKEGRIGELKSYKLNDSINVATPPEFPGGVEGIWSPEHLVCRFSKQLFYDNLSQLLQNTQN
ncbi:MAG: hypothetical protein U5K71_00450 [Gracilimonas sp.]|nr:hypothetical protein [Gracilimonas sp.]